MKVLKEPGISGTQADRIECIPTGIKRLLGEQPGCLQLSYSLPCRLPLVPSKYMMTVMIFVMMLSFYYFARHVSACTPSSPILLTTHQGLSGRI